MATRSGRKVAVRKSNAPAGPDNFEFDLDIAPFEGYDSTTDPTTVDQHILVRGSQNVYQKISGTIANRPGRKLIDSVDGTLAPIKSAFIWNTSLGFSYPIRLANSLLQFYSTISGAGVWYTLMSGIATANQRIIFDAWFDNATDKKDMLLFVMHDANTYKWDGGVALFVSAVANTSITLDRAAAANGFASSGTVTINGATYAYSGISGSNLTGVTGDASAQAANSAVFSTVKTNSNTPSSGFTNDFIKVLGNQLYSGSYTDQRIFLSKNTDYTDHGQSTPRLVGEGDTIILDDVGKGIGVFQGQAVCFSGTNASYLVSFKQNITTNNTISEITQRTKYTLGNLVAAQGHEFIDTLSDNILYLDQANQLRSLGNFKNFFTTKAVIMSLQVQTELSQENFAGGALRVVNDVRGDLCYITAPSSGKTYLYLERITLTEQGDVITQRIWQPPQQWNISRVDSFNAVTIGFSNSNPQMYQLWDTLQWHDDSPSGQLPYTSVMLTGYHNGNEGRRQGKRIFEKIFWEGYASRGTQLYGSVYYDYQGSTALLSVIISDLSSSFTDNQIFTGVVPPSLGDASLGDNPIGDGLNVQPDDQSLLPKFRVINGVQPIDCFEYALMVYSANADDRWEILSLGTNARYAQSSAVEIIK